MQKSETAGEKLSNPYKWFHTVNRDKTSMEAIKLNNRIYWNWEIKYNNLKVL